MNANKDLNEDNVTSANSNVKKLDAKVLETDESNSANANDYNSETDSESNFKLKLDKIDKLDKSQIDLNIQNLSDDPDKLDLDILDLNHDVNDNESITLDIEELS